MNLIWKITLKWVDFHLSIPDITFSTTLAQNILIGQIVGLDCCNGVGH